MSALATEALSGAYLRKTLSADGSTTLRIHGSSMAPLLPNGSTVRLRKVITGEALNGAFVAIDRDSKVVVHRVDSVQAGVLHTRGLRAKKLDTPCSRQQILGVVSERVGRMPLSETNMRLAGTCVAVTIAALRGMLRR